MSEDRSEAEGPSDPAGTVEDRSEAEGPSDPAGTVEDRSEAEGRMTDGRHQPETDEAAAHDRHLAISSQNPRRTETGVGVSFIVATLAGVGLAVTYALGGQTQLEGVLLFFCLGGLGFGMTLWGKQLMPHGPFVQQRHSLISTEDDRDEFVAAFTRGEEAFGRRKLLLGFLAAGFTGLGAALLFPIRSLGPSPGRSLFETPWATGARLVTPAGKFIHLDDLEVGGVYTVFPEGHIGADDAQTLLIRADSSPVVTRAGRETWSPNGYLAYSKLCTHAGCPVGLYEHERQQMLCPCHQSTFNVLAGCQPVFGPATRSLPQLPIMADPEGFLRAQSDYTEPVGPGFWNR